MPLWLFFKGLPLAGKIGIVVGALIALASIVGGIFYTGYAKGKAISAAEIAKYEKKVSDLNGKLKDANAKTAIKYVTKYVDRDKVITETVIKNKEVIKYKVPEQFKFSQGWVYAYNQSVQGLDIDPAKAAVDTASNVTDRLGLSHIAQNNGVCLANENQLNSLSGFYQETKRNADKVGK